MKMSEYAGSSYIKLDDVRDHSRREVIADIRIGSYDRPEVTFESGAKFSLNKTNVRLLIQALGDDSRDWPGAEIELYPGQTRNMDGEMQDSVLVRMPASAAKTAPTPENTDPISSGPPKKSNGGANADMNDDIPF